MKFYPASILIILTCNLLISKLIAQINPANNQIGVDVSTMPEDITFNYDSCFVLGKNLGMSRVGLFQTWTALETAPLTYNMLIPDIANIYYPLHDMSIDLTIAPINTNQLEVPADLAGIPFDDPVFIDRFETLLDSIKVHTPDITFSSLIIGSEHDIYFGGNATLWNQYTTFYNAISVYAKTIWPGLNVATELTFNGLTAYNTLAQALNTNSDYIGISYYPIDNEFKVKPVSVIPEDFETIVSLYPDKSICFYQYGYPSGIICNSSEDLQADFIAQTFTSWDEYAENIKLIDFTWLHDLDIDLVNYYSDYYGIDDPAFLEYLHTLGLRTWDGNGTDKPAFTELECQATLRGFNDLDIDCPTAIYETNEILRMIKIYPNPASGQFNISIENLPVHANIFIYNPQGSLEKTILDINTLTITIQTTDLTPGLYNLIYVLDDYRYTENFTVIK